MKKEFFKIVALVLFSTFVFQNCDNKNDTITDLTPDNMNDLIANGLYGKVKLMTSTYYRATWDAVTKKPVTPVDFSSRETSTFNEQGFETLSKRESFRTTFTIAEDKKSATAKKESYNGEESTFTFDAQNRITSSVEKSSYGGSPNIKINDNGTEKTVYPEDRYFIIERDTDGSPKKITANDGITILEVVYSEGEVYASTIVYDDANKTAKKTDVSKRGNVTNDSTVYTCKLLPNGRIDESNMEGISYDTSVAASKPEVKIQMVAEKDEKGNITLRYFIGVPYKADGTLDEERTNVDSYTTTTYEYWQ